MIYLLIFVAGILFALFIMPLLEGILTYTLMALETKRSLLNEIKNKAQEKNNPKSHKIGFTATVEKKE